MVVRVDWRLFLTSFGLLFMAELGDKTQLAVLSLVTKHQRPLPVFLGASLALTLITLIAATVGHMVSKVLPQSYIQIMAGSVFITIGVAMVVRALLEIVGR